MDLNKFNNVQHLYITALKCLKTAAKNLYITSESSHALEQYDKTSHRVVFTVDYNVLKKGENIEGPPRHNEKKIADSSVANSSAHRGSTE